MSAVEVWFRRVQRASALVDVCSVSADCPPGGLDPPLDILNKALPPTILLFTAELVSG